VSIASAILGLGGFVFGKDLAATLENHRTDAPLLSQAALLFLVDCSKVPVFQWVSVIASALTLGVGSGPNRSSKVPGRAQKSPRRFTVSAISSTGNQASVRSASHC